MGIWLVISGQPSLQAGTKCNINQKKMLKWLNHVLHTCAKKHHVGLHIKSRKNWLRIESYALEFQ